ncbi:hypothetical protein CUJ83_14990 [Methanocella sp. CWC-04]|uniref:NTP pyrophosphohydrolase MazG-like domain-containing protein n=1 Tax=Methanooceanicella nereidis TaxID=2052831 RepID=A0AAP2W7D4_9EURY|nr:MazG nucleotide pyrophosphohydrolase domain-containing protein [Methanocella sp. CWC-04]MCD1296307.1 hypothetical protein [Methanocella sp. CWC-04]
MSYTIERLILEIRSSLPDDYVIRSKDDALIKAAFTAEELGEVVRAISRGSDREVVKECADTIVGLLQIIDYYNEDDVSGIDSAFGETLNRLKSRKNGDP